MSREKKPEILLFLFFLLFFFLPVGWAKHWLIPQSLANGVLVDYLMPDFWLQDFLALLIVFFIWKKEKRLFFGTKIFFPGLLLLILSLFFSSLPLVSLINLARFFLAVILGWFLTEKGQRFKKRALIGLKMGLIWTGILAFLQFIKQKSVFGWWFLGEPFFSLGTGGVKKIEFFNQVLVTPMATLPHSNVLGAFGLLSKIILLKEKKSWGRNLGLAFAFLCLTLSFSLPVWILFLGLILFQLFKNQSKPGFKTGIILGLLILFSVLFFKLGLVENTSLWRRRELIKISLLMAKDHFFFGVGWGCFVKKLPQYWQSLGLNFRFLQPVHNIFLIMLSEVGFLGFLGIILVIGRLMAFLIRKELSRRNHFFLLTVLALSLIDHYFWTTTQGVYLFFLLFSLNFLT